MPVPFLDTASAAIVFGGTAAATLLRCGRRDARTTLHALPSLARRRFDAERVKAELALQLHEIRLDGLLRAEPHRCGDAEFDEAADALIAQRSIAALPEVHERHRTRRRQVSEAAAGTLREAAELAPVFGMVGTLVSLGGMAGEGIGRAALGGAVAMAVVTTLYGLLAANLLFAPLARMIERAAAHEEAERDAIVRWLGEQLVASVPGEARTRAAA